MKKALYILLEVLFIFLIVNNREYWLVAGQAVRVSGVYVWLILTAYSVLKTYGAFNWKLTIKPVFVICELLLFILSGCIFELYTQSLAITPQIHTVFLPLIFYVLVLGTGWYILLKNNPTINDFTTHCQQHSKRYLALIWFLATLFMCPPILTVVYSKVWFVLILMGIYVFLPYKISTLLLKDLSLNKCFSLGKVIPVMLIIFVQINLEAILSGFCFYGSWLDAYRVVKYIIIVAVLRFIICGLILCVLDYKQTKGLFITAKAK